MSLINCPSCQKKISDKASVCSHCDYSFDQSEEDLARQKVLNYRVFRDKMYQLKMLGFASMALAVFGLVPMLWTYAKAIDYGFNASITNHWGKYFIVLGFLMYVTVRVLMLVTNRNYHSSR